MKDAPVIFIMFSVILSALAIVSLAGYYGSDWTWIGEQVAGFVLIIMVFGLAIYALMSWLGRR